MTHAFTNILQRRELRRQRLARAGHVARRSSRWVLAFALTTLAVVVLAGFAEGRFDPDATFICPWTWLPSLAGGGLRPIAPLTGLLMVLYAGGWLTVAGLALLRLVLRFGYGPIAVSRSVLDEAVRNKVVVVVLGILLIALAAWPYSTTSAAFEVRQPLRYQIQSFLSFSSIMTALLLGGVTIFFAAHTISQDINVRRAGDVFVKPISRVSYLLGKWLGVMLIVGLILAIQTAVVWGVARFWLGTNYAMDAVDMAAINQRVLIARGEALPQPERPFEQEAEERLLRAQRDFPDATASMLQLRGWQGLLSDYVSQARSGFLSIEPGESKTYVFTGLADARRRAIELDEQVQANAEMISRALASMGLDLPPEQVSLETIAPAGPLLGLNLQPALLQWRFKVKGINTYGSLEGALVVRINDRTFSKPVIYVVEEVQVIDLPATYVDERGMLKMEIFNSLPNSIGDHRTIQFDPETWMQIYYVESDFGSNLIRGSLVHLSRFGFLAMLGLVTGALWSFPVAATFSMSLWLLASGGAWMESVLTTRIAKTDLAVVNWTINDLMMPIVATVASFLSAYSVLDVGGHLVDGRYIPYTALIDHFFYVTLVWTGLTLALGGWLFSRREIARVQV